MFLDVPKGPAQSLPLLLLFMELYNHPAILDPDLPHPHLIGKSRTEAQTSQSGVPTASNPAFWRAHFPWELTTKHSFYIHNTDQSKQKRCFYLHFTFAWKVSIDLQSKTGSEEVLQKQKLMLSLTVVSQIGASQGCSGTCIAMPECNYKLHHTYLYSAFVSLLFGMCHKVQKVLVEQCMHITR